ncbi:hypothetical protein [Arthrobacter zhaoxinii]|uniref:hypothetical protein n=1 Tax=Arthrobacter zhaoxinii TaxID=2964616 RepID=UPI0021057680|nr:hypothetical protein [Arthrobacter zhaoxinii]MCQ2000934.1 hypothetical protein [Arthrobacter zhaoxinii]
MTTLMNRPTTTHTAERAASNEYTAAAPAARTRRRGTYTTCYDSPQGTPRPAGSYVSLGRRAVTRPRNMGSYVDTSAYRNRRPEGAYTLRG